MSKDAAKQESRKQILKTVRLHGTRTVLRRSLIRSYARGSDWRYTDVK